MTSMRNTPLFHLQQRAAGRLTLASADGHLAHVFVLETHIVRVMVLPGATVHMARTWAIAPGADDVEAQGRDRFDLSGFSLPAFELEQSSETVRLSTDAIRLTITLKGLFCAWECRGENGWQAVAQDRGTQGYNFGWWDDKVYHYLRREADELYFGLGERSGEANRHGQRYRLCNIDPMGYSAKSSDPLYKHIPFYLTWKRNSGIAFGLFYDTLSDCVFDMGRELDGYHGHYRYFAADHGDLDYYFIAGPSPAAVTQRYTWLTGRPAMMPKWSIGYSGSTMTYTDAPDAQQRMSGFLHGCRQHDILCDSFHLSSGYTSIDGQRCVFNWNRDKFPDPAAFVKDYLAHGVRLCANIKPCLLDTHPQFDAAQQAGLFVHEADGTPSAVQFWDGTGAYLDFTHPDTTDWWKQNVKKTLLAYGIAASWNDNNEFEIWSPSALCAGFGTPYPARETRPLQTLLMIRASRDAQREYAPGLRPFLISRAGAAGMQRYVQTWSGDNYTSWETLRYNIKMAMGLALSGVSNTGHDIGGFAGPAPDAELLLRWVQHGIFLPRFSIHSWNDDHTVNEPWMHAEISAEVAALIKFRYRLIPYLYDLLWRSHRHYEPMIRPTLYDFPQDPRSFEENDDMMLGRALLVASIVEPGQHRRRVHLPAGVHWYDFWTGHLYRGGEDIEIEAGPTTPPLLARAASALPLNLAEQHFADSADRRGFAIFPPVGAGHFADSFFEDDGISDAYHGGDHATWQMEIQAGDGDIAISLTLDGHYRLAQQDVVLLLPPSETRRILVNGRAAQTDLHAEGWRRLCVAMELRP